MLAVVALGGNAIAGPGLSVWVEDSRLAVKAAAESLRPFIESGGLLVVTHGNGPQVGLLLEKLEGSLPLWLMTAMTQAWIGHLIVEAFESIGARASVVTPSRVLVDPDDSEFAEPSKPVGRLMPQDEAKRLAKERGWRLAWDPRGGYRRLVPSPRPISVVEHEYIAGLAATGIVTVALGGGGVPVRRDTLEPVEAVIDKDLSSSVLARQIDADILVILTDVPGVAVNYGRPGQRWLKRVTVEELERLAREGHFPKGNMGPKVEAAIEFTRETGRPSVIARLEDAWKALKLEAGTVVIG